jgi:hypothetical protein
MPLEYPALVVGSLEFKERLAELFGIPERAQPKEILFEDPDKSLGAAIALRLMDKSRRRFDPKESKFLLKKPGHKLRAMVMANGQPLAMSLPNSPKHSRTPWRIGSRASKRVPHLAAWIPTHSMEQ